MGTIFDWGRVKMMRAALRGGPLKGPGERCKLPQRAPAETEFGAF